MKLRYIFAMIIASLTFLLTGCQEEERYLSEVNVSSSYVAIPVEGGDVEITVTATDAWTITGIPDWFSVNGVSGEWVTEKDKNGKDIQVLKTATANGDAGESKVIFHADAADATREATVYLNCASATQNINVIQMAEKVDIPISPIEDVLAAQAGTFRIKGEVYGIYNTTYGNFYMKDETGSILIYGCLDANGAEKNFSSLGIDNGDVITVEGPLTVYNGVTWELVNVTVIDIEKSLLKIEEVIYGEAAEGEEAPTQIALEGGSVKVVLTSKTGGVNIEIAEDAKSWLSVGGMDVDGTTVTVTLNASANNAGDRAANVTFVTKSGDKTYTATTEIAQKGSALTFDQFMALENDALGTIEGIVTGVHKKGFVISNSAKQALYVYVNNLPEVALGDKVVASGKKSVYNKCYQVAEPTYSVISSGNEVAYPTPAQCTDDLWAEMVSEENPSFAAKLVKVSGEPTGDYGDIAFGDGCSLSPYQTSEEFNYPAAFEGKKVTIIGYVLQVYTKNDAKTLRVLPVSIKEATDEDLAEPTYTDVIDFAALVAGGATEYNVNLKDAVVSYVNGKNAFIEDATGGILLYAADHGLVAGNKITGPVSGAATIYNGLPELTSMDYSGASVKADAEIPCTELTIAELLEDYTRYMSCRVLLKGVTVADGINLESDRNGVISQGDSQINLYSQDKTSIVVAANSVGDLICYPTVYKETKQVGIWQNDHFTAGEGGETPDEPEKPVMPETEGEGTLESPYTPADALAIIAAGAHDKTVDVYIAGTISKITEVSVDYGNAGYYISADGTETNQLQIFRGKYLNGEKFTSEDQIKVGDKVVILGKLDAYNGNPQVAANSQIVTLEPVGGGEETPALTVDGKQWLADMGGVNLLVDLGVSEEGMMVAAIHDGTSYVLEMAGTYTAMATDATSGTIIFTPMDLATEQFGAPMTLPYSGLTETSVNVVSADIFGTDTPVPFTKATEFIDWTVPGEGGEGGDVTENSIENGAYWIVADGKAATPVAEGKKYDYLGAEDMVDGVSYAKNVFTFTYNADETKYTIQDSFGRYLYGSGTYNNFNVSAELPATGAYWSVVANGDGTYDIYNGATGYSITFADTKWEQRHPDDEAFSGVYPTLVKAENPLPDPVEPEAVDLTNVKPEIVDANKAYKEEAVINGELTTVYKIGTSKVAGSFDITVPAGSTKVSCYAVAWRGSTATVQVKMGDTVMASQDVAGNDGATSNSPYTITSTDSDKYVIELGQALPADTKFTLTTSAKARVLFWSIVAE